MRMVTATFAGAALAGLVVVLASQAGAGAGAGQAAAPNPPLVEDPAKCRPSFYDDFHHLDVSAWGPGTRWIAHTPAHKDFGDAAFTDPSPGFPFRDGPNGLTIEAKKIGGQWHSGILSSTDGNGQGFSQTYGYFEMRAKLPPGPGTWPAFWLGTREVPRKISIEVDAMEYLGMNPKGYQVAVHIWRHGIGGEEVKHMVDVPENSLTTEFHRYGVDVEPTLITFYFDRKPVWSTPTPVEHKEALEILVNLALGSGYPIDKTPDPSDMLITSIAAYPPAGSCAKHS